MNVKVEFVFFLVARYAHWRIRRAAALHFIATRRHPIDLSPPAIRSHALAYALRSYGSRSHGLSCVYSASRIFRAKASEIPVISAIFSGVCEAISRTDPNARSNKALRLGPIPSISSSRLCIPWASRCLR